MGYVLNVAQFSQRYKVRCLNESDVDAILALCQNNTIYYQYCPPLVTRQSIFDDMTALPPNKTHKDKFYVGYFEGEQLIAVMDVIKGFPHEKTVYIGFFMTHVTIQNKGIATSIIDDLSQYLSTIGIHYIQLSWVKNNPQATHFWLKNKFMAIETAVNQRQDTVIKAIRKL